VVITLGLIVSQRKRKQRATPRTQHHANDNAAALWTPGRAYVAVQQWGMSELGEDEAPRELTFSLVNRGRAPATIIATAGGYQLEQTLPPPFDPLPEQLETTLAGAKLSANTPLEMSIAVPSGPAFHQEIASHRMILYAFVYVKYEDGLGQHQEVSVFVEYKISSGHTFIGVGGQRYNYST
jgi:hypothetical protein